MTKPTKWLRPAKTPFSLGIRPIWSESLLSAWRNIGSLATHWAHSEDSDQTGRMPKLIWVFAGRTYHFVGFFMRRHIWASFFFVEITVSDPSFIGEKSYMSFAPVYVKHKTDIKLQIKPTVSDGLVFYVAMQLHSYSGDFLSLVLHAGKMEMRYHHGDKLNVLTSDYRLRTDSGTIIMSHVTRKPVFGVSDQVRLEPACSADKTS